MKKRFPALSLVLALALCLGLTVPAFAADAEPSGELFSWYPEDSGILDVTVDLQVSLLNLDDKAGKYGEPREYSSSVYAVPNSADYRMYWHGMGEGETIGIFAISDPDGDGVYKQRAFTKAGDVLPAFLDEFYDEVYSLSDIKLLFETDADGDVVIDAARLFELFGDNTVVGFAYYIDGKYVGESVVSFLLSAGAFDDVPGSGWYSGPVAWAAEKKIAQGVGNDNFAPGYDCTHIQILTFLSRAAGNTNTTDYDWAEEQKLVIKWAEEKGMIGEDFDPGKPCTRAEAVNYIWQAKDKPSAAASSFNDMEGYEDYAKAVDWAAEKKVATGSGGGKFDPGKVCNRAEIATFLYRAYNN